MIDRFPQLREPTLHRMLLARAERDPHGVASILVHAGQPDSVYTISDLLRLADQYASVYRERLASGNPESEAAQIVVCLYHGIHLHAAFIGGMLAGQIPTMVAPPSPRMEPEKYARSFVRMMEHIAPDIVVTEAAVLAELEARGLRDPADRNMLNPDDLDAKFQAGPVDPWNLEYSESEADAVAFIQHSSGTTGLQKGIALSHAAVRNQLEAYARTIDLRADDRIATWLPLYHDMGFIACFVLPLCLGIPIVEISPFEWVNSPATLLHKIQQHRATLCWLPNFAFSFLARSVRAVHLRGLDLNSVRLWVNCSEPVMAESSRRFVERFGDCGVDAGRLAACYAMAENVFAVTQSPLGQAPRVDRVSASALAEGRAEEADGAATREFVSNGKPIPGVEVQVVDDAGEPCGDRQIGEIYLRGSSLFSGYFKREDLTAAAFLNEWYHTGDLGYQAEGDLFVAGRKKDLIIIQGRNFHPGDIEAVVSEVGDVIDGRVVAIGQSDEESGTESLVVIAETELEDTSERGQLGLQIRNLIAQRLDCAAGEVHLVPPRWLIKSTAGKIARSDNRSKYEAELRR